MNVLYFDCFSGISGDMAVGALLHLGVPAEYLTSRLNSLGIEEEYEIDVKKALKCGIEGTDFNVILKQHDHKDENHHNHGRNLIDINKLIDNSDLNENIKNSSKGMFKIVAEAEAKVHGKNIDEVHFHEVGAVDSIIDIVGTAICMDYLKPDIIYSSPVNTGRGFVKCQHGLLPVPAPATANILEDVPVYCDEREFELTTPTGAAIIKYYAREFKKLPSMKAGSTGYGCGKRETEKPNLLRIITGEISDNDMYFIEATIDDMNPQIYSHLSEKLFSAGARDVYYSPVYMKKNRPGIVVSITAPSDKLSGIENVMFRETTTIGLRRFNIERTELQREFKTISTEYGDVRAKVSRYNGEIVNISPEYEDVKLLSEKNNIPFKKLYNYIIGSLK